MLVWKSIPFNKIQSTRFKMRCTLSRRQDKTLWRLLEIECLFNWDCRLDFLVDSNIKCHSINYILCVDYPLGDLLGCFHLDTFNQSNKNILKAISIESKKCFHICNERGYKYSAVSEYVFDIIFVNFFFYIYMWYREMSTNLLIQNNLTFICKWVSL